MSDADIKHGTYMVDEQSACLSAQLFAGSEMSEVHLGIPDVEKFFTTLRDAHPNITLHFKAISTGHEGNVVWFLAESPGHMDVAGLTEVRRDGMLKWRQFHGSESRPQHHRSA
ncbi:hypothetical protein [Devosia sp.]|uniref:hypothetical protein n=1 Tax=Devosia sp. TaxID=1871048 RepID=UPI003265342A